MYVQLYMVHVGCVESLYYFTNYNLIVTRSSSWNYVFDLLWRFLSLQIAEST